MFLREFHAALDPDDVVWVVGPLDGLYLLFAAAVVGQSDSAGELVADRVFDTGVPGTSLALLGTGVTYLGTAVVTGVLVLSFAVGVLGSG